MEDAAACGHPLHITGGHLALVPQAIAVFHRAGEHICDGLDASVRVPWKSGEVVFRIVVAEIIQKQEWIEILGFAEAECALQLDASAFQRGFGLNDLSYWS